MPTTTLEKYEAQAERWENNASDHRKLLKIAQGAERRDMHRQAISDADERAATIRHQARALRAACAEQAGPVEEWHNEEWRNESIAADCERLLAATADEPEVQDDQG